jgi:glycosyltransferase involved in cell wall biosynthesis
VRFLRGLQVKPGGFRGSFTPDGAQIDRLKRRKIPAGVTATDTIMIAALPIRLSVVVPVFREEDNLPEFLNRTVPILESLSGEFEVIFALDPSPDGTERILLERHQADPRIKVLKFSRRIGQPMATLAGLQYATGDAVVVMDVDLQDPPEVMRDLVAKWREGYDVVLAQRRSRDGESWIKKVVAWVWYRVLNRIADAPIPPSTGDFRLLSRRAVEEINKLKECHGFLRGLVALVGFKQTSVLFDRPARYSGSGNYNRFLGSMRIGLNGLFCFSSYLLTLSSKMGFLIAGGSFLTALLYAGLKVFGFPFPIGNPTIVILVLFMGGIQLISVGILGEYIARIYEEVKERPKFIVDRAFGFAREASALRPVSGLQPAAADEEKVS